MIRMLHFADVHLGVETYGRFDSQAGNSRVRDFLQRLDEMIRFALANDVDVAVFAGDAFKNRQPNPTLQREFAYRIRELADRCPVIMIAGNHDLPNLVERAHSLEIYQTLAVPNVLVVGSEYQVYPVQTKSGGLLVGTAPYPVRGSLLNFEEAQGKSMAQIDLMLQDHLRLLLRDMVRIVEEAPEPRVLMGHFTVQGAEFGTERNVMVGRDAILSLGDVADPAWDYVALGHIHKHQNLTATMKGYPPVIYSGSLERVDFGEEADDKGFCWVELERGATQWRFVKVGARPFVTLRVDVRGDPDPMARLASAITERGVQDAIVRLILVADLESDAKLREAAILDMLRDAGAFYVAGVQREVERPTRSRLGANVEGMTSRDLLKQYLRTKKAEADHIEEILDRAAPILDDDGS
ncbi:MAG: exonuclease SbcCD subunit D [Anaerolineae bacterium]|nr:exonuclease SbcCD subunit D [Anaerolineae bacterium]